MDRQEKDPQPQDQTEPELPLVTPAFDPQIEPELPLQAEAAAATETDETAGGPAPAQATTEGQPDDTVETKPGEFTAEPAPAAAAEAHAPLGTEALQATLESEPKAALPMQKA